MILQVIKSAFFEKSICGFETLNLVFYAYNIYIDIKWELLELKVTDAIQ